MFTVLTLRTVKLPLGVQLRQDTQQSGRSWAVSWTAGSVHTCPALWPVPSPPCLLSHPGEAQSTPRSSDRAQPPPAPIPHSTGIQRLSGAIPWIWGLCPAGMAPAEETRPGFCQASSGWGWVSANCSESFWVPPVWFDFVKAKQGMFGQRWDYVCVSDSCSLDKKLKKSLNQK